MTSFAAKIWGALAATHNTRPRSFGMASIAQIGVADKVETATIHWFHSHVERGRSEVHYARATIVPGVASAMLALNPNNRNLSDRKVQEYARDMLNGRWALNGEPIIISDTGELNDGQHRLQAVIESNSPQEFFVGFGFSRESRTTVDQGMARTSGHYLAMDGVANASLCAGIAGIVTAIEESGGKTIRDRKTHAEIVARVKGDHEIGSAAYFSTGIRKFAKGLITPSQIGAAYYLFAEINKEQAAEYLTQVCVGENIKRGDPAFAVRSALAGLEGEQRLSRLEIVFRGWNAYRQGRRLQLAKSLGSLPALV